MKKLLYIHGLASSGSSNTANVLRHELANDMEVISPDLPPSPVQALDLLTELCQQHQPAIVVGSSMGGMFAQKLHGYNKILINPAFHVSQLMRHQIGKHSYYSQRQDGIQQLDITEQLCDEYEKMESRQFRNLSPSERENTWALFGRRDEVVDCSEEYAMYYSFCSTFDGEHQLSEDSIRNILAPLVRDILSE